MKIIDSHHGGFGRVDIIETDSGEIIAKKTFDPPSQIYTPEEILKLKLRFKREVKIQSQLPSDYVIPVIDSDLDSEIPSYTMPCADRNFSEEITDCKRKGVIPTEALADILNSLESLHSLGIVHRDLKPKNILLHNGKWKLSDFGLVLPPNGTTTKLTATDSGWGTSDYSAPEQLSDFRSVTIAADIYSFGCILHEIHSEDTRIPYNKHTCDGEIGIIIEKCTEKSPKKRIKSVASIRSILFKTLDASSRNLASPSAEEWLSELETLENWDEDKLEKFTHYLKHLENHDDRYAIYSELDDEMINKLFNIDTELWKVIALEYCEWIKQSGFDFNFCDVLIRRIQCFFNLGDMECKASATIAGAKLGSSHNRWYVMEKLLAMCDSRLDDKVAERIAIEIVAEDAQEYFITCVNRLSKTTDEFHSKIRAVLGE